MSRLKKPRVARGRGTVAAMWLCLAGACTHIPSGQYGVRKLTITGVQALDEASLRACLATKPRKRATITTRLGNPACGQPPFLVGGVHWETFAWPWTEWPIFDSAVFELDLRRVSRWYEARGYYDVQITDVELSRPEALRAVPCRDPDDGCVLDITIHVREGDPVRVAQLAVRFEAPAPAGEVQEAARTAISLKVGQRWDEQSFRAAKASLVDALRSRGHAHPRVDGDVFVDRKGRKASVRFDVRAGPVTRLGSVRVKAESEVPRAVILDEAGLHTGDVFSPQVFDLAQRNVYALGSFSAVTIREGEGDNPAVMPVVIEVTPRKSTDLYLGAGVTSGVLSTGPRASEQVSIPQWDVHLVGRYEHRNFLGGLRKLRIEERPRLIFLGPFPKLPDNSPRFGNTLSLLFEQPGVPRAGATLWSHSSWDFGPDPFQLFFRHALDVAVGLRRGYFDRRVLAEAGIHQEVMRVAPQQPLVDTTPSGYRLPFLQQTITLDLRRTTPRGTGGVWARLHSQQAAPWLGLGWYLIRVRPEIRGYVPLGAGVTLAARFRVGAMVVLQASKQLDEESQRLGPQTYRERGGGAQDNRGFAAGQLGDSVAGGLRSWLGSVELRVPFGGSLSLAAFADLGDVSARPAWRFDHLNTALGAGLRYDTLLGPIRFDVAGRPAGLARADGSTEAESFRTNLGFTRFRGAIHLTIGDAF